MHTLKVIGAGFGLLGLLLILSPRLAASGNRPIAFAVKLFIPVWFAAALVNLWVGVTRAGYGATQEWPIFLVVFGVPALAALLLRRLFGRPAA